MVLNVNFCCRNVRPYIYDALKKAFVANPGFSYFPKDAPQAYIDLALQCTNTDAKARPTFADIIPRLQVRVYAQVIRGSWSGPRVFVDPKRQMIQTCS